MFLKKSTLFFLTGLTTVIMLSFTSCNVTSANTQENDSDGKELYEKVSSEKGSKETDQTSDGKTIRATLSSSSRKMPVYGFNGNITRGPTFANKAFRDFVASLGLKIIRYPGGSVSNFWDWQKGWFVEGEVAGVTKNNKLYSSKQTSNNGLDQLKMLVDEADCDVVFTLNMVSRTIEDQIEMLKNAQSLGIPIKWIELGNEFNLQRNPGREKFVTPSNYGKVSNQWINNLKKQFPNVKIAVVGGNRSYNKYVKNWNNDVLRNVPNTDAMVAHIYADPDQIVDGSGINFKSLFEVFENVFTESGFTNVGSNKFIWVTEYNIIWSLSKDKSVVENSQTWGQALSTLLMTSSLTSLSDKTQLILNHNIANSNVFAAIETANQTFKKLPNGLGMEQWFKASDKMTSIQKILFNEGSDQKRDFEVFGWKFYNNDGKYNLLITNLTPGDKNLDLSKIIASKAFSYTIKYANKQAKLISNSNALKVKSGRSNNLNSIELPPYSVAIISL